MDKFIAHVDLAEKEDKLAVVRAFQTALGIPLSSKASWDAFYDSLRSLDTDADAVISQHAKSVHIVIKNLTDFERRCRQIGSNDYNILIDLLAKATDKKQRYDGVSFTFEVDNG